MAKNKTLNAQAKELFRLLEDSDKKLGYHKNIRASRLKRLAEVVAQMNDKQKEKFVKDNPQYAAALLYIKAKEKGSEFLGESKEDFDQLMETFGKKLDEGVEFASEIFKDGKQKLSQLFSKFI